MTTRIDFLKFDALDLAELVRNGETTAMELLEHAIQTVEDRNPSLNAVVHKLYDFARAEIERGLPCGPFSGVPFMLKDLGAQLGGTELTNGSRLFAGNIESTDSHLVSRLRQAGLVIMGRTNSCELGLSIACEPEAYGPTKNPYDESRSSGGSSGGAAAAVAAGMVPFAHATDGCGSIRVPAANCGLFGLKPTRARTPAGPFAGEGWNGMSAYHAITRSVRDSAALLDATSGPESGDPYHAPARARDYLTETRMPCESLSIGFSKSAPNQISVHPDCVAATVAAVSLCEELGHQVEEAPLQFDLEEAIQHLRLIWATQAWQLISSKYKQKNLTPRGQGLEQVTWQLAQEARSKSAADYHLAIRYIHGVGREIANYFDRYQIYISPTTAQPAWKFGEINMMSSNVESFLQSLFSHSPFTAQFNISGQPAMSVPLHWSRSGIPIGVQFAGRFGEEGRLFRLAAQLEKASPWCGRRNET